MSRIDLNKVFDVLVNNYINYTTLQNSYSHYSAWTEGMQYV